MNESLFLRHAGPLDGLGFLWVVGQFRGRRLCGQREEEGRAASRFGFDPDAAAMSLDDLLADGQARARAVVLLAMVQAAKDAKDLLVKARLKAHSGVAPVQRDLTRQVA